MAGSCSRRRLLSSSLPIFSDRDNLSNFVARCDQVHKDKEVSSSSSSLSFEWRQRLLTDSDSAIVYFVDNSDSRFFFFRKTNRHLLPMFVGTSSFSPSENHRTNSILFLKTTATFLRLLLHSIRYIMMTVSTQPSRKRRSESSTVSGGLNCKRRLELDSMSHELLPNDSRTNRDHEANTRFHSFSEMKPAFLGSEETRFDILLNDGGHRLQAEGLPSPPSHTHRTSTADQQEAIPASEETSADSKQAEKPQEKVEEKKKEEEEKSIILERKLLQNCTGYFKVHHRFASYFKRKSNLRSQDKGTTTTTTKVMSENEDDSDHGLVDVFDERICVNHLHSQFLYRSCKNSTLISNVITILVDTKHVVVSFQVPQDLTFAIALLQEASIELIPLRMVNLRAKLVNGRHKLCDFPNNMHEILRAERVAMISTLLRGVHNDHSSLAIASDPRFDVQVFSIVKNFLYPLPDDEGVPEEDGDDDDDDDEDEDDENENGAGESESEDDRDEEDEDEWFESMQEELKEELRTHTKRLKAYRKQEEVERKSLTGKCILEVTRFGGLVRLKGELDRWEKHIIARNASTFQSHDPIYASIRQTFLHILQTLGFLKSDTNTIRQDSLERMSYVINTTIITIIKTINAHGTKCKSSLICQRAKDLHEKVEKVAHQTGFDVCFARGCHTKYGGFSQSIVKSAKDNNDMINDDAKEKSLTVKLAGRLTSVDILAKDYVLALVQIAKTVIHARCCSTTCQ